MGIQLQTAEAGPTSRPARRLSHLVEGGLEGQALRQQLLEPGEGDEATARVVELRAVALEGDDACVDEGAMSFVTDICVPCNDYPYKRE